LSKNDKKDTDKIKFFKIDTQGSIASAVPGNQPKAGNEPEELKPVPYGDQENPLPENSISRPEPHILDEEAKSGFTGEFSLQTNSRIIPGEVPPELNDLRKNIAEIASQKGEGSLSHNQIDVLRRYISLKETEVKDLRDQQRQYQSFAKKVSTELEASKSQAKELLADLESVRNHEEGLKKELQQLKTRHEGELQLLKNDYEEKLRVAGNYEVELSDLLKKKEEWKEKVKEDLKRIKLKEKELENKHELLKRDTQALLDSKDRHLLELKKKNDAFELEMESLEEKLRQSNSVLGDIDSKKRRLIETLKLALSLLEGIDSTLSRPSDEEPRKKAG
jgi:chromosome segregation ATPase